jgi:hypothetical protein
MTPWQSLVATRAMSKRRGDEAKRGMAEAWHIAAFTRSKRMPPLNKILGDREPAPKSADHLVEALKAKFGVAANG